MPLTRRGRDHIVLRLTGEAGTPFAAGTAYLGVGESGAGFDPAQTDLQARPNKVRKRVNADFPVRDGDMLTFQATFGPDEANFEWREWGVFNAAEGGVMLCRKPAPLGRKRPGETWQLEVEVTITSD